MSERAKKALWHGLVLAVTMPSVLIYMATGHDWGDDFALYIIQALQLVGKWTGHSGYIFNPYRPTLGPPEYPWGFPLMLAPVAAVFGNNMSAFLVWMKVLFLAFYQAVFLFGSKTVGRIGALAVVLGLAFNPFFIEFKNEVMSDVPFALCVTMAMWATMGESRLRTGLAMLFAVMAVVTREAGVALVAGFAAHSGFQWLRSGRNWAAVGASGWAAMAGLLAYGIQTVAYQGGYASHFEKYHVTDVVATNAVFMAEVVAYRLFNAWYGPHHSLALAASVMSVLVLVVVSVYGIFKAGRAWPWVALSFLALFLLFPFSSRGFRFLVPLLPLLFLSMGGLALSRPEVARYLAVGFALLSLFLNYDLLNWMHQKEPFLPEGPQQPYAQQAFAFVRDSLPPDAVMLFDKPRALALYTHRSALCAPDDSLKHRLPELMSAHGVTHVMVCNDVPCGVIDHWIEERNDRLTVVYASPQLMIYKTSSAEMFNKIH